MRTAEEYMNDMATGRDNPKPEGWGAIHNVKSVQPHFDDVCFGAKTAELRKDDRGYAVGDILRQHEYVDGVVTGRVIAHQITHKLTGAPWLADGYCMLSLARIPTEISY